MCVCVCVFLKMIRKTYFKKRELKVHNSVISIISIVKIIKLFYIIFKLNRLKTFYDSLLFLILFETIIL